jgi:glycosyltransferase involved in cell wall biosynthesis
MNMLLWSNGITDNLLISIMDQKNAEKSIAIFTGAADVFTNPTLVSFFELMQEKGFTILLVSYKQIVPAPSYFKNILQCFLPPMNILDGGLKNSIVSIKIYANTLSILKKHHVSQIIGIDYYGFIIAARFKRFLRHSKLGYFSFELLFSDEIQEQKFKKVKKKELHHLKKLDYLIIQDDMRLSLFLNENQLKLTGNINVFKIPVAPKKISLDKISGWNIHHKLNIPEDKKIIVYSGSVGDWAGADQLLELLEHHWNQKFWLVIHSRFPLSNDNEYLVRINQLIAKGHPVSLHANPFDNYLDYAAFLKNADVAIVLYKSKEGNMFFGKNIREIGLASGKFSMYLMLGIPVIASNQTTYRELLKKYNFGGVIEDNEGFPKLLEYCCLHKGQLSKNALTLYDQILDPEKQLYSLIEQFN